MASACIDPAELEAMDALLNSAEAEAAVRQFEEVNDATVVQARFVDTSGQIVDIGAVTLHNLNGSLEVSAPSETGRIRIEASDVERIVMGPLPTDGNCTHIEFIFGADSDNSFVESKIASLHVDGLTIDATYALVESLNVDVLIDDLLAQGDSFTERALGALEKDYAAMDNVFESHDMDEVFRVAERKSSESAAILDKKSKTPSIFCTAIPYSVEDSENAPGGVAVPFEPHENANGLSASEHGPERRPKRRLIKPDGFYRHSHNDGSVSNILLRKPSETVWNLLKSCLARARSGYLDSSSQTIRGLYRSFPRQQLAFESCFSFNKLLRTNGMDPASEKGARVWSFEGFSSGKRYFLAADHFAFMKRYWQTPEDKRHIYEIIPGNSPCRLYFDIEYPIGSDTSIDGEYLVATLLELISLHLKRCFGLDVTPRCNILELDSSTTKKFSRHIIFHLKQNSSKDSNEREILFASNEHVGAFVKSMLAELLLSSSPSPCSVSSLPGLHQLPKASPHPLWVPKEETSCSEITAGVSEVHDVTTQPTLWSCIVDIGVYTKNRAFRLLGSRKYGKGKVPMSVAASNEFEPNTAFENRLESSFVVPCEVARLESDEQPVAHSNFEILSMPLVKPTCPPDSSLLIVPLEHAWALPLRLIQSGDRSGLALALVELPLMHQLVRTAPNAAGQVINSNLLASPNSSRENSQVGSQRCSGNRFPSPFPCLDRYVEDFILKRERRNDDLSLEFSTSNDLFNGHLRSWSTTHLRDETLTSSLRPLGRWTITYQINNRHRYCERICRPHKSNSIMIAVSFRAVSLSQDTDTLAAKKERIEIDSGGLRQRCWDPECRGFDFKMHPLPPDLLLSLREHFSQDFNSTPLGDTAPHATAD